MIRYFKNDNNSLFPFQIHLGLEYKDTDENTVHTNVKQNCLHGFRT